MTLDNELAQGGAPGIGARLRSAREARGLSYEAIAAELRIRVVILAALEREDHAALPERVYLLGHLRTYARCARGGDGSVGRGSGSGGRRDLQP